MSMKNLLLKPLITVILVIATLFATGCAISFKKKQWSLPPKTADQISVMEFNVENLFDTVHDEGSHDYTYMPFAQKRSDVALQQKCRETNNSSYRVSECLSTDWNEFTLDKKLRNLSEVVLSVDGNGPDVLLLVEVENQNVLNIWNQKHLKPAQYQTIAILKGPDLRGINLAVMSRLPMVGQPQLHKIPWKPKNEKDGEWMNRSRDIFEVTLKAPNGDPITFFVAHFPSQANPVYWREQATHFLAKLIKDKGPQAMVVASGDLNITHEEEKNQKFYENVLGEVGAVSHFIGCKECKGTHNYRRSWSFLDAQIYSKALLEDGAGSYKVLPETIDVISYAPIHLKKGKYPNRWDHARSDGVSDHFPIYARLQKRSEAKTPVSSAPTKSTPAKSKSKTPQKPAVVQ